MGLGIYCGNDMHEHCPRRGCGCECHNPSSEHEQETPMPTTTTTFACDVDGCDRTFDTQQGLSMHKTRTHAMGPAEQGKTQRRPKPSEPEPVDDVDDETPDGGGGWEIPQDACDVAAAIAFLDDELPSEVFSRRLQEWADAALEDDEICAVVEARRRRREQAVDA